MNKNIVMEVYSTKKDASIEERMKYIQAAYDKYNISTNETTDGYIRKFHNETKFKNCASFISPYDLIRDGLYILDKPNEIFTLVIYNTIYTYESGKIIYSSLEMIIAFQSFLYKLFNEQIYIKISLTDDFKISNRDMVLSYYITHFSSSPFIYEIGISIDHKLTNNDTKYIERNLKKYIGGNPSFINKIDLVSDNKGVKYIYYLNKERDIE